VGERVRVAMRLRAAPVLAELRAERSKAKLQFGMHRKEKQQQ